jgi:protein NrfD
MLPEITSTRANPLVDPGLHVWGWEIPIYLFLGGLVAGMMLISGYALLTGRQRKVGCVCYTIPPLALGLLSLGMVALWLDLEHKLYVWRLYTTFEIASPMSWGAWILLLVYPSIGAALLLRIPSTVARFVPSLQPLSKRLLENASLTRAIGAVNMALGAMLGIYTGILLSALGARPLWGSALLGPLFLISGLSTAAALVHLIATDHEERERLARADIAFLGVELALIGLYLIGLTSASQAHMAAASLLLGGPYTAVFWVFVVALGIVVPLIIQPLAVTHRIQHTPVAPLLVIMGGICLRFVIVTAGQVSHWGM